ncbi:MAG: response regulator [Ignavibacteriales bacterium]|nr:response regulator [Ignavibacteriales bacterium]
MIHSPLYNSNNLLQDYKHILEGITDGFFALDEQYRFAYWNKAAEEGTGFLRNEVLGKNVFEIFPNAKDVELGEKYRAAMETKTFQRLSTQYSDERFDAFFDVRIFPMENGIVVFFHDITEEKRQQKQKESLHAISKAINSAETIEDLCVEAGKHIAQFLEIPENFVCVYRYDERSEMLHLTAPQISQTLAEESLFHQSLLLEEESKETVVQSVAQSLNPMITDELVRGTLTKHFLSDVEKLQLKTLIVLPLVVQGELFGVLEAMSFKDVEYVNHELQLLNVIANELAAGMSRKRLLEEVMVQKINVEREAKKTAEANATLKRFLATFSHDLRAPLASIVGFSEVIANDLATLEPTQVQEFMRNITTSGRHLQNLIGDILDLSKIESGTLELHVVNYPVSFFTDSIQRIVQSQLDEKKVSLQFKIENDVDVISVDQTRFQQILVNLISNAIKFSPEGKTISVSMQRKENDIEFSVRDEGKGIAQEEIHKLFQPFHQVGDNKVGGTGLGLAISKRLVELHGGKIWIESEEEKYSEFKFLLPIVVSKDETIHREDEEMLSTLLMEHVTKFRNATTEETKPLALLVDDSEHTIQLLQNYFHGANFQTETARNGVEALEKAKEIKPDVITLDILLPIQNGWRVMKELKEHPVTKHIPIIVVSVTDQKTLGFSLGAADYFVKPVSKEELLIAVKRALLDANTNTIHIPTTLVIDDDENFSELIDVMLSGEGLSVLKAMSGKEGLRFAEQSKPDVIILDMVLPDMSGIEVAHKLKQNPLTREIPIIILTSLDIDEEMREELDGITRTMLNKSSFTKKDVLREIGSIEKMGK